MLTPTAHRTIIISVVAIRLSSLTDIGHVYYLSAGMLKWSSFILWLIAAYVHSSSPTCLPACPVIYGRRNGHRWFFAIVFCHPPSFFSIRLVLGLPLFLFPGGFMSIICLQTCSSGRLLTSATHFNRLSGTLLDIFTTPAAPRMYSYMHKTLSYLVMSTSNNCMH